MNGTEKHYEKPQRIKRSFKKMLLKDGMQMARRHVKICSLLLISQLQIKSKMKYYTSPVKMTFSKMIKTAFIQVPQTQKQ